MALTGLPSCVLTCFFLASPSLVQPSLCSLRLRRHLKLLLEHMLIATAPKKEYQSYTFVTCYLTSMHPPARRLLVRPSVPTSQRPTVRPSVRPTDRQTVRPSDRPTARRPAQGDPCRHILSTMWTLDTYNVYLYKKTQLPQLRATKKAKLSCRALIFTLR